MRSGCRAESVYLRPVCTLIAFSGTDGECTDTNCGTDIAAKIFKHAVNHLDSKNQSFQSQISVNASI
jgi:hypothetical protein